MKPLKAGGQNEQILGILKSCQVMDEGWVSLPFLSQGSGSLNISRRITDLRQRGHRIENRVTTKPDGSKHSEYRLLPQEEQI